MASFLFFPIFFDGYVHDKKNGGIISAKLYFAITNVSFFSKIFSTKVILFDRPPL
jgi:hypothetical protein